MEKKPTLKSRIEAWMAEGIELNGIAERLKMEQPDADFAKLKRKVSVYLAILRRPKQA